MQRYGGQLCSIALFSSLIFWGESTHIFYNHHYKAIIILRWSNKSELLFNGEMVRFYYKKVTKMLREIMWNILFISHLAAS